MAWHHSLSVVASAGQLTLGMLAATRVLKSPLAFPLMLLCLVLFGWNFAALGYELSNDIVWRWVDVTLSPFTLPAGLHFIVTFAGERRRLRWLIRATYAAFGVLSLLSASAFFSDWGRSFSGSEPWALIFLCLVAPGCLAALIVLIRHYRHHPRQEEQTRTHLVVAALLLSATFGSSELLGDVGLPVPRLGNVATFASTGVLAVVAFRFQLFERNVSLATGFYALVGASTAIFAYLLMFRFFATNTALLVIGVATVTLVFGTLTRRAVSRLDQDRERTQRLAMLGRLSAQMAHDLKNPLASLKGSVQFLEQERKQGRSIDGQGEFLTMMGNEIERLARLIDKYRRLGSLEPVFANVRIDETLRALLERQRKARPDVTLDAAIPSDLPVCSLDEDLITAALENIVQNAFEAMPEGGTLSVVAAPMEGREKPMVSIVIKDTGTGMNPRQIERVFEEFFTTKATGTGIGLPFARRVAEAHGGDLVLFSREGEGTDVRLRLPAKTAHSHET